ncbi:MAG: ribonuclease J, partial [Anaerolineales bacterium]|nr:ribonuclease J [Anaerolineales bacterium]
MSKKNRLRIIPLGGLGEVGKNMMAYEYGKDIIVVDAGIMFPKNDMLGVDYIIPDFEYLKKRADKVLGLFITHGHED